MNYDEGKVGDRVEIGGHYGNIVAIEPNDCCLPYIVKWDEIPEPMRVLHTQLRKVEHAEDSSNRNLSGSEEIHRI